MTITSSGGCSQTLFSFPVTEGQSVCSEISISATSCHCSGRLQKELCTSGIMSTFSASSRTTLTRSFQLCLGACTGSLKNTGTREYLLVQSVCLLNSIEFMLSTCKLRMGVSTDLTLITQKSRFVTHNTISNTLCHEFQDWTLLIQTRVLSTICGFLNIIIIKLWMMSLTGWCKDAVSWGMRVDIYDTVNIWSQWLACKSVILNAKLTNYCGIILLMSGNKFLFYFNMQHSVVCCVGV